MPFTDGRRFEALHKVGASRTIKGISEANFQNATRMQCDADRFRLQLHQLVHFAVGPCFTTFYHVLPRKSKKLCKSGGVIGKAEDFDEGLLSPTYSNHFSFFNVRRPHYFAHSRATFFGPGQARDMDSL